MPAMMPPAAIQGVRRPNMERVRSDRFPTSRLETSEASAVAEFSTAKIASLESGAISVSRCGNSTAATTCRASIQHREKMKKAAPNLIVCDFESDC